MRAKSDILDDCLVDIAKANQAKLTYPVTPAAAFNPGNETTIAEASCSFFSFVGYLRQNTFPGS